MPSLALHDIQTLTALQGALAGFAGQVQEILAQGQAELHQALDDCQQQVNQRRQDLEAARERLSQAEYALEACQCSGYYGPDGFYYPPDCSFEELELEQAQRQVEHCEQRLETAYAWQQRLEQAATEYESVEARLQQLAENHTGQARVALAGLAARYQAVHGATTYIPTQAQAPAPRPAGSGPVFSAGMGAGGAPVGPAGVPGWVPRGILSVAVAALPDPQAIAGPQDFSKVPQETMRAGLLRLQEMRPTIEGGPGASADYWAEYDRQHALSYEHGYQRIYEAFYGRDAITVNKDGETYDIINGRHRLWLARQMGITHLPMRVIERA